MIKKTRNQRLDELRKLDEFRWEFLKRNPQYQKDYQKLITTKEKFQGANRLWSEFVVESGLRDFPRKYGLYMPMDPSDSREEYGPILFLPADSTPFIFGGVPSKMGANGFPQEIGEPDLREISTIQISINLDYSKQEIMNAVEEIVDDWLAIRRDYASPGFTRKRLFSRKRLKEWQEYLKVWDLRVQKKSYQQIGIALWPKVNFRVSEERAKKAFYRAHELIMLKPYDPIDRKKITIPVITKTCETCEARETCKELCPPMRAYVEQDEVSRRHLIPPRPI